MKKGFFIGLVALGLMMFAGAGARADDDYDDALPALGKQMAAAKQTLEQGITAATKQGKPISAQFEIDDGKLQISIYTTKGDDFSEVVADPKTGAIVKTEKVTDTDELNDAADQKTGMAKAKTSLAAAADAAVKENSGFRAVSIFPDLQDGHAIAEVTLLQGTTAKKVTEKLD